MLSKFRAKRKSKSIIVSELPIQCIEPGSIADLTYAAWQQKPGTKKAHQIRCRVDLEKSGKYIIDDYQRWRSSYSRGGNLSFLNE